MRDAAGARAWLLQLGRNWLERRRRRRAYREKCRHRGHVADPAGYCVLCRRRTCARCQGAGSLRQVVGRVDDTPWWGQRKCPECKGTGESKP